MKPEQTIALLGIGALAIVAIGYVVSKNASGMTQGTLQVGITGLSDATCSPVGQGYIVGLYDSATGAEIDVKTTDAFGVAYFASVPAGLYFINFKYNGAVSVPFSVDAGGGCVKWCIALNTVSPC